MKKLIIVAGMIVVVALTFATRWWLPRFLDFTKLNSEVVQTIASLVQLAIWLVAGIVAIIGFWFSRKKTSSSPIDQPKPLTTTSMRAEGPRSVAVTEANNANIITGDGNVVVEHLTINDLQTADITYYHQLPPETLDFTDRLEEVTQLETKLKESAQIFAFFGLSGVGKSALANRFIHRYLVACYPDAQFYIDLKGTTENPKSVSDAQRHIIGSSQALAKILETDHVELSAKYNSVLYGKRAVLFLDNASNKEQIAPLTPPANCAMVITSRQKIVLSGMHWMDLTPLKPEDARALLLKIEPRIGSHADQIATLCGGLPQALRIAASTLAEHPDLSVEEYVARLSDRKNRLEFVEASLDLTYKLLSATRQKQFGQLAIFPETFDVGGAAAIWSLSQDNAKSDLGEFVRLSLLEWHAKSNRYRLQTLVRDFADAHLPEHDRSAIESRYALYYLMVLNEAGNRYLQGDQASRAGVNLFDIEKPNIRAACLWIQSQISDPAVADIAIRNYSFGGSQLLALKELPSDRIEWHQTILNATRVSASDEDRRVTSRIAEAGNLTFLGEAYRDLSDYDQTIKLCEEAVPIAREIGNAREESNALGFSGIAYYYKGNYQEACDRISEAIAIAAKAENKDVRGDVERLRYLGHSYRGLGRYDEALEAYQSSLKAAREFGDLSGENAVLSGLGRFVCDTGDHELARTQYFPEALRLAIEIGDKQDECYALAHLAMAHREVGMYAEAKNHYQQALKLAALIGHRQLETYCRGGLAKAEFASDDLASALSNAQLAVKLADQIKMTRAQQFWRTLVAQIYLVHEQLEDALTVVTDALSYQSEWVDYRSLTLHGLVLAKLDRNSLAVESFENAITKAQNTLTKTPKYFEARYFQGIAAYGLALTNPNESSQRLTQSVATLEQAYDNCSSAGVVSEVLGLLKKFEDLSSAAELDKPRLTLEQLNRGKLRPHTT
jgi:tetratricopeptide (TPR) repeat protein